jgi:hypothetical protein
MLDRVSCPFCNASFRPAGSADVHCPRCGEAVPVPASVGTEPPHPHGHIPTESVNGSGPYPSPSDPPAVARPLRPLAGIGLAMLLLVLGAGAVALFLRPAGPPPAPSKPPTTWPPAAVPGLAYLPADATVAAAIQPRAIKNYLDRTNSDRSAVVLPAEAGRLFDSLGLRADQVEAVVAGVVVRDNNPLPPLVVVVTVAPPFDEAAFWKAVKADRDPDAPGRYKADLNGFPVYAAKAADGVFAFASRTADLDGLEARAGKGGPPLSADLRESVAKLSPASVAWAATGSADWANKPELKLWATLAKRPDALKQLAGATAAAVGVALEPDPKLRAAVRGDESIKQKLTDAVGEPTADGDWWTAERPIDPGPKK